MIWWKQKTIKIIFFGCEELKNLFRVQEIDFYLYWNVNLIDSPRLFAIIEFIKFILLFMTWKLKCYKMLSKQINIFFELIPNAIIPIVDQISHPITIPSYIFIYKFNIIYIVFLYHFFIFLLLKPFFLCLYKQFQK